MTVTVSDKDGNYVTLPVTVSYGVLTFTCLDQPEFQVSRPSEDMLLLDAEEDLQKKVNAAMAFILLLIREISVCYDRMMCIVYLKKEKEGNSPIKQRMNRCLLKGHIG